jgi:hypothetical protein
LCGCLFVCVFANQKLANTKAGTVFRLSWNMFY